MKRIFGILTVACLIIGAVFILSYKITYAQKASKYEGGVTVQDNRGVDEGYNNDPYDVHGCVWRDDFLPDGTINYHAEEPQTPPEFYIEAQHVENPCDAYTGNDWINLKDRGEAALWPPGCFNPVNFYNFASGTWQGIYGAFEMNQNYNSWDKFYYAATGALNKRKDPANIDLKLMGDSPAYGEELGITAIVNRFHSPNDKMLYGWATQLPDQNYLSQQGLVSGGRQLTASDIRDFQFPSGQAGNLDTCKRITRQVSSASDRDNDGLDDTWEVRYAPRGDISELEPEGDPDNDGVTLSDPSFLSQENKPLLDSEGSPIPTPDVYNGTHVTPDTTAKSAPGDGKFTNMEEFIWGTNPLDPDTDDDGFPDEADVVGLGQSEFKETTPVGQGKGSANRMNIRVATVGISELLDERNSGHLKVLIDSDALTVIPGIKSDLQANLFNVNEVPIVTNVTGTSTLNTGEDIFIEAITTQTEGDRAVLDYTWYLEFRNGGNTKVSDRVQIPPTPEFTLAEAQAEIGRMGRYTFRHPITELVKYVPSNYTFDAKSGSFIYVTVEISNLVTHEFSKKRIPVSLGSDQAMGLNITDLNTGTTMAIEDYVTKYCYDAAKNQIPAPTFCSFGGKSYNEILPWIVFEGSRIEVVAQPIQANTNDLVFEWRVNDEKVTEAAGADSADNKLVIYPDSQTKDYDVFVKGYSKDEYRNEIFEGGIAMTVQGPQVAIIDTPISPTSGTQVQLTGQLLNFPEQYIQQPDGYAWTISSPDGTTQQLHGKVVALPATSAGNYHVKLEVAFQGPDNSDRTLTTETDVVIGTGAVTAQAHFQQLFASMLSVVKQKSSVVYEFGIVAALVIVGMLYLLGFIKKKPTA